MNGRIFDPGLGRFLQVDPVVQAPESAQGWNAYTYVFNNPLAYTDPTGAMSIGTILKIAAAIVITIYTGGWAAGYWGAALTAGQAVAVVAAGGFVAGAITTGTWKGALIGAFSAVAFYGIGQYATNIGASDIVRAGMHAMTGGIIEVLQGGNFGHGFVSAGLSKIAMGNIDTGNIAADVALAALVGGAISEMTGGKFANGVVTAAMQMAFNELGQRAATRTALSKKLTNTPQNPTAEEANQIKVANRGIEMARRRIGLTKDANLIEKWNGTTWKWEPGNIQFTKEPLLAAYIRSSDPMTIVVGSRFADFNDSSMKYFYHNASFSGGDVGLQFVALHEFGHVWTMGQSNNLIPGYREMLANKFAYSHMGTSRRSVTCGGCSE